ncbi:MAG: DUF2330 domain-containing protein [Planctomycetales bacterium]|nr:DUF2330 domain-containing protein [Planctomycetales bacterium]
MKTVRRYSCAWIVLGLLTTAAPLWADPCGMVPPISVGDADNLAIKRIGAQQTYVFYKSGLEVFIIRPGYEGKIDEFGMLIPFPTPPAIRKAPDAVFTQLANAIDPPEVVVDLRPVAFGFGGGLGGSGGGAFFGAPLSFAVPEDKVEVVREEAVGMYEVAVLAAGSAAALEKWLDEHKYRFPTGMEKPAEEYVKLGWCFVAVKTRVGAKNAVDPEPGQRKIDDALPQGAVFDGHVQAMEFRFPSRELIVPMRLSAFNAGATRNVVYLLADRPAKIRNIPEEYVVRQISGKQLLANMTEPLPLRVIGGELKDIPRERRRTLPTERDPKPHTKAAADLIASNLLAIKSGSLLSPHEEVEKEWLSIGERLMLRGPEIDAAADAELAQQREKVTAAMLAEVRHMSLTIVDGEFPREVLAKDNLRFGEYVMPQRRSNAQSYDAKLLGPGPKKEGVLHTSSIDWRRVDAASRVADGRSEDAPTERAPLAANVAALGLLLGGAGLALLSIVRRRM